MHAMKLSKLARSLCEEISELAVIDAHEHLPPESEYLAHQYSGLNMFAGYLWHDLESAGMSSVFKATMRDGGDRPVENWWPRIAPYWDHVKHSSYAKALHITVRDLWGIDGINDTTIHQLAERVKADNTPGLYHRVLQERCKIVYSLSAEGAAFPDDPHIVGISPRIMGILNGPLRNGAESLEEKTGLAIRSLEDAVAAAQTSLREEVERGARGLKIIVDDYGLPDARAAETAFRQAHPSQEPVASFPALYNYIFDKCLDVAAEANLPVAVHTGYWGDFRQLDPKSMLGFALRRQDVHFDLFHLGIPMVRDAVLIGKNLRNVTLNLTWCPIISQVLTTRALDEIIDLVPSNKIIAFGADYRVSVQKAYGHLVMARECVAVALANRIEAGDFGHDEATRLATIWFHDNARRVYGLA